MPVYHRSDGPATSGIGRSIYQMTLGFGIKRFSALLRSTYIWHTEHRVWRGRKVEFPPKEGEVSQKSSRWKLCGRLAMGEASDPIFRDFFERLLLVPCLISVQSCKSLISPQTMFLTQSQAPPPILLSC